MRLTILRIQVLKALVHELAGHWAQLGQKVRVDPSLRRADKITSKLLRKLKKHKLYKTCLDDLEKAFQGRLSAQKKLIKAAIDKRIEQLG